MSADYTPSLTLKAEITLLLAACVDKSSEQFLPTETLEETQCIYETLPWPVFEKI